MKARVRMTVEIEVGGFRGDRELDRVCRLAEQEAATRLNNALQGERSARLVTRPAVVAVLPE